MKPRLVLASQSPRRARLLHEGGYEFAKLSFDVAELTIPDFSGRELTLVNAVRKARGALARTAPEDVVLAADTLVVLDHEFLGKPASLRAAKRMLARLSNRSHFVFTSVVIAQRGKGELTLTERSEVIFQELSAPIIAGYIERVNPLDKAGGYAAQKDGLIERINGSQSNVIGLPMEATTEALKHFGIFPIAR